MERYLAVVVAALLFGAPTGAEEQALVASSANGGEQLETGEAPAPEFELAFDHSNVVVSDLAASASFYMRILQLEELPTPWGVNPAVRFFSVGAGQQIHMVQGTGEGDPTRVRHMAFTVRDLDAYLAFLREEGVVYSNFAGDSSEPQVRPDGVRQIYFSDPDGNWIEVNDATYGPVANPR